ncbi:MAG: alpha/beta fold hydrolase [Flavobacteriales bacterium]
MNALSTPSTPTSFSSEGWTWQGRFFEAERPARVVVAFHGFGRPMEEMGNYLPLHPEGTAMLSVGIAHQNGSTVPTFTDAPPVLEPALLLKTLDAWLDELGLSNLPKHLLGYSLGGRISLALFEHAPEAWAGMVLLASDGFKKNAMYRFAVETALGRACWAFVDRHAEAVRSFIRGLRRARIIPAHLAHFALHHTEDHAMRQLVSNTWKTHRLFWPSRRGTAKAWGQLPQRDVHVHAVFGDRDAIIPWAWSRPWRHLGSSHVHFVTVNSGHVMRHPETVEAIHRVILGASNET